MSHYRVAVLSDGTKTIDELLAPYQEGGMGEVPREYLAFRDTEDESRDEYASGTRTFAYVDKTGRLYSLHDEVFRKPERAGSLIWSTSDYEVPEALPSRPRA